jgi:hypothetical protein
LYLLFENCDFLKKYGFPLVFNAFSWCGGIEMRSKMLKKVSWRSLGGEKLVLERLRG